jgi:SAM-dependent methyltransferase
MATAEPAHSGFAYSQERWDWASANDHARWITGSTSLAHYDRSGWLDALRLVEHCPGYRAQSILEWGCGSGRVTQYLCYLFLQTHAVDISSGMRSLLMRRGLPNLSVHSTSGADLPVGLSVDIVYSYLCWMHNRKEDLAPILRTSRSVLRDGGRLLFQLPVYDVPREPQTFLDLACWTPEEFCRLAGETGFEVKTMAANPGEFSVESIGPHHFELHEWIPCANL